jgi:hypothetical protein
VDLSLIYEEGCRKCIICEKLPQSGCLLWHVQILVFKETFLEINDLNLGPCPRL